MARFVAVGFVTAMVSFGLLSALVYWADMATMPASLIRGVCMTPVTFLAGRHITWRSMRHFNSVWWQFAIHVVSRPVTYGLHQLIMLGCLGAGLNFVYGYWISVTLTGVFNLFWGEKVTFTPRWARRRAAKLRYAAPATAGPQPA